VGRNRPENDRHIPCTAPPRHAEISPLERAGLDVLVTRLGDVSGGTTKFTTNLHPHTYTQTTTRSYCVWHAPSAAMQPVRQGHPSETAAAAASSADVGGRRRPSVRRSRGCGGRIRFAPHTYWGLAATATAAASTTMSADVSEGDVVVVVGASGRLGSLVTQRWVVL